MRSPTPPSLIAVACALQLLAGCVDDPRLAREPAALRMAVAQFATESSLQSGLEGAERVLIGTVERVSAAFGESEHGDRLIISSVAVRVEESLRGPATPEVTFALEGGTIGELTLVVSDLPTLRPGDRGLFALRRDARGTWVPNRRGLGLLALSADFDLARVRRAAEATR